MAHRHNFEPTGGCTENPGVWIDGKVMRTLDCTRTDHRRQLDFSTLRDPESLTRAIAGLLSRRRDPMTEHEVAQWFRATPAACVEIQLDIMAARGQLKTIAGARGVTRYYTDDEDE